MTRLTNDEINILVSIINQVRVTLAEAEVLNAIVVKLKGIYLDNQQVQANDLGK